MNLSNYNNRVDKRNEIKHFLVKVSVLFTCFVSCIVTSAVAVQTLTPFTTDGCSSFPDGLPSNHTLFLHCCTLHDFAYWQGGTMQQRLLADQEFAQCINELGQKRLSEIMLLGVRVGGTPYLPTPFRWGYGWPYPKGYGALLPEELSQVKRLTPARFKIKEQ